MQMFIGQITSFIRVVVLIKIKIINETFTVNHIGSIQPITINWNSTFGKNANNQMGPFVLFWLPYLTNSGTLNEINFVD